MKHVIKTTTSFIFIMCNVCSSEHADYVTVGNSNADYIGNDNVVIQQAVDYINGLGAGGTVHIKAGTYSLKNSVFLYDNIILEGEGTSTLLKKAPGQWTYSTADALTGSTTIELQDPSLIDVGYGVKINLPEGGNGWEPHVTTVLSKNGNTITVSDPLKRDYLTGSTVEEIYPLIAAYGGFPPDVWPTGPSKKNIVVRNMKLDGNREENPSPNIKPWGIMKLLACMGGIVYFWNGENCALENLDARNYAGTGLSMQYGKNNTIRNCKVYNMSCDGVHPGTANSYLVIEGNTIHDNGWEGLYICGNVRHSKFRDNVIHSNALHGISIGRNDDYNVISRNRVLENLGNSLYFRPEPHDRRTIGTVIAHNKFINAGKPTRTDRQGVFIHAVHHDITLIGNEIIDNRPDAEKNQYYGVYVNNTSRVSNVKLYANNVFSGNKIGEIHDPHNVIRIVRNDIEAVGITHSSAKINWISDEETTSQVEYGLTTDYGSTTSLNSDLVYYHLVDLTDLNQNAIYHYRVRYRNARDVETVSEDHTFTTLIRPTPTASPSPETTPIGGQINLGVTGTSASGDDD